MEENRNDGAAARPLGAPAQAAVRSPVRLASFRDIFGIDLRTLALFRVLLGLYLILDLCLRARDLVAHYTDVGLMPRTVAVDFLSPASFSLHMLNGTAAFQAVLFLLAGVFALMMVVGWRTRAATIVSWVLLLSLQNRNTVILSGEDNLAMLLLFWAMFLPLGARYSVDASLDRSGRALANGFFSLATMALLIQGMSMYFFSALLKSDARWIPDGTAVYYALQLDYFATPFALWFRQFEDLLQGLTYGVWALELIGPILIFSPLLFRPLRTALMTTFICMHFGFYLCLEIGIFPLISIIMNLTFLPGQVWDGIERRLASRRKDTLQIWYDRDCGFCLKTCRLLKTFLFLSPVPLQPAQSNPQANALFEQHYSWVINDGDTQHIKWDAMRCLVAASLVFWPVATLMSWRPFRHLGDRTYGWITRNRLLMGRVTGALLPWRRLRVGPSRTGSCLAGFFLVFITVQNLSTLPAMQIQLPQSFLDIRQFLGLYQDWTMFAPYPELTSPWPVIVGERTDGLAVDVYRHKTGIPAFSKPAVVSAVYENYRWRKFLSNLEDDSYVTGPQPLALNYARYLCRLWNTGTSADRQLATFTILFMVERTPPSGIPKVTKSRSVWTHNCFG